MSERTSSASSLSSPRVGVDAAALAALTALALVGFRSAYGGVRFLVVGLVGTAVGLAIAWAGVRFRQPALLVAVEAVAAFFVLGGAVALPDTAIAGVVPSASTVRDLGSSVVTGWAKLVTTRPPVGASGHLLVVPYLCGFAAAGLGFSIALRLRRPAWALAPSALVLALTILLGTGEPVSLTLQGGLYGAVALLWLAIRVRSGVTHTMSHAAWRTRSVSGLVLLGVAGALATAVGPSLPGADAHPRYVLRDHVQPPLDPARYPSPLNGFRNYLQTQKNVQLFSVTGLPAKARIRLATMDSYNGLVWSVVNGNGGSTDASGYFARVGDQIAKPSGKTAKVTIQIENLSSVWVPDVGTVDSVDFAGPRAGTLRDAFRFNTQTNTGVVTAGLTSGDRLTMHVTPSPVDGAAAATHATATVQLPTLTGVPDLAQSKASDIIGAAGKGTNPAKALSDWLSKTGGYSDGEQGQNSLPGHGAARMIQFFSGDQPVGDGEQFASAMALMARQAGLPARVVLGFKPSGPTTGTVQVTGADISAWVEVDYQGVGWLPFDPTPPKNQPPTPHQPQSQSASQADNQQQHRHTQSDADTAASAGAGGDDHKVGKTAKPPVRRHKAKGIPVLVPAVGIPVLLVLLALAAIVGGKVLRRRRRKQRGSSIQRIHAGWLEILDTARDLGHAVPARATRREVAQALAEHIVPLARKADEASFAPHEPTEDDAAAYWSAVDQSRNAMLAGSGAGGRTKAALSLTSLRPERRVGGRTSR